MESNNVVVVDVVAVDDDRVKKHKRIFALDHFAHKYVLVCDSKVVA